MTDDQYRMKHQQAREQEANKVYTCSPDFLELLKKMRRAQDVAMQTHSHHSRRDAFNLSAKVDNILKQIEKDNYHE